MPEEKDQTELNVSTLIEKMAETNLDNLAIELKSKKNELEKQLSQLNPYIEDNTIKMIVDYATILNATEPQSTDLKKQKQEKYEHLVAATFAVAYAVAQGVEIAEILPIMALAGVNTSLGKKITTTYLIELKKQS